MATTSIDIAHNPVQSIPKVSEKPLKNRYQLFVNEYLVSQNAALSARKAGYSEKRSKVTGYMLLRKPEIREAIEAFQKKELEISEEKVTKHINRDVTRDGYLTMAHEAYEECGAKHSNAPRYMEIIGKVKGFFGDMVQNVLFYNSNDTELQAGIDSKLKKLASTLNK